MTTPTGRQIAAHLGITPGRVSQLKHEGLPTDSIEAAERWYRANVDPVRSIGNRLSRGAPIPKWPDNRQAAVQRDGAAALDRAARLGDAAHHALAAGAFGVMEPELRAALRAVPLADRSRLELPEDVLEELCADVLAVARKFDDEADRGALSDEDVEWLGDFWYRVAAGEVVPRD